jgi:acyl-CoA synthetase (AMP-forming)/AMP-acid ligase II
VQKCPEQVEVVDGLPRNSYGKVLKQELKARLA